MRCWLLVFVLLTACASSAAPTATAIPTPVDLTAVDLESILIQSGDLPAGVTGAQVRSDPPEMFKDTPATTKAIYQQLARGAQRIGGVTVLLYQNTADRDRAYAVVLDGMGEVSPDATLGEQSSIAKPSTQSTAVGVNFQELMFRRCAAVVHVRMVGDGFDVPTITAYAKRLDQRLTKAVC